MDASGVHRGLDSCVSPGALPRPPWRTPRTLPATIPADLFSLLSASCQPALLSSPSAPLPSVLGRPSSPQACPTASAFPKSYFGGQGPISAQNAPLFKEHLANPGSDVRTKGVGFLIYPPPPLTDYMALSGTLSEGFTRRSVTHIA